MSTLQQTAQNINTANQSQSSQALVIQAYANSINEQPSVDFSGTPNLGQYQVQINNGLLTAQSHATNYLNSIQPQIIQNISNISNYYALNNAVPTALPAGSTAQQWIAALTALQSQATQYQDAANGVVAILQALSQNLSTDAASFAQTVSELNAAVNGDNGVLASLNQNLNSLQKRIDAATFGVVAGGILFVGGIIAIIVGVVATIPTAGVSTALVAGGIAAVTIGAPGTAASALVLTNLNNDKAALLTQEANLSSEVILATGISNSYQSFQNQVQGSITAATQMQNAWESLSSDLGSMISDLQNGIQSADQIRTLFLTAANTMVSNVIADTNTIKGQMAGVTTAAQSGQTVGQAIAATLATAA